jgi:hypothetical protein
VLVAHARDLQGIGRSDRKNDRNDAEKLARYARMDPKLLNPIEHRTEQQQTDLCAIRAQCEEAGDCGGGTQAGGVIAPTLGKQNDLSAVSLGKQRRRWP